MKHLNIMLKKLGYIDVLTYKNELLYLTHSEKTLCATSLFFIDAGYKVEGSYVFALSSPLHEIKGTVLLTSNEYQKLMISTIGSKFKIDIEDDPQEIIIHTQYGMRKIHKSEFDPRRYILRKGFPDFPACPYGHTFKMLGYDTEEKVYVRLTSSLLKDKTLETITYKE